MTPAQWRIARLRELTDHNETMRVLVRWWRPPGGFTLPGLRPEDGPGTLTSSASVLRREARRLDALADAMTERARALIAAEAKR